MQHAKLRIGLHYQMLCLSLKPVGPLQAAGTFALLLLYGIAVIPLAYCLSFSFSSPSAAQANFFHDTACLKDHADGR